jgi:hypothetical protein
MKLLLPLLFIAFSTTVYSQKFSTDDPARYNNYMVNEQIKVGNKMVELSHLFQSTNDVNLLKNKNQEVVNQVIESIKLIENMEPFKGDAYFRDEVLLCFKQYKVVHESKYVRLAILHNQRQASYDIMEEYFNLQINAEKMVQQQSERAIYLQDQLCKKYNIEKAKNPLQETMDMIRALNKHYREVYIEVIPFLRIDDAFLETINGEDFAQMKRLNSELLNTSVKAISNIEKVEQVNNYSRYQDAAIAQATQYKNWAQQEYQEMIKILENKPFTQETADRYNAIIQEINDKNVQMMNEFNAASVDLINKNMPR